MISVGPVGPSGSGATGATGPTGATGATAPFYPFTLDSNLTGLTSTTFAATGAEVEFESPTSTGRVTVGRDASGSGTAIVWQLVLVEPDNVEVVFPYEVSSAYRKTSLPLRKAGTHKVILKYKVTSGTGLCRAATVPQTEGVTIDVTVTP